MVSSANVREGDSPFSMNEFVRNSRLLSWRGLLIRGQVATAIRGQVSAGTSCVCLVFRSQQERQRQSSVCNPMCQSPREMLVVPLLTLYKHSEFLKGALKQLSLCLLGMGPLDGPYKTVNS